MDEDTATRFVSSLVKSIQALCNGYINFTSSIEVIGHIHLNIDRNVKFNYVLTEEVSKSVSEGATLFASHSYHSHPPPNVATKQSSDTPRPNRRKSHQVPRIDDSDPLNIVTLLPVPDVSSVEPDNSFNSTHVGDSSDSSHSGKFSAPQDSSHLLNVKPEKWQPATTCMQDSLDRRRKNTSSHKMLSPAAKRSRNNDANSTPAIQNPDFGVIEIKEEPEEPSVCLGDSSSMAVGQDIQTPDFSNVVMESLDRVGQIEGSQLVAGGDSVQQQQQQQPFPVMLHANPSIPTSAIPVSAVPVPGPSTDVQATPSTSGVLGNAWRSRYSKVVELDPWHRKYSKVDLDRAVALVHQGFTAYKVETMTGVPISTIRRHFLRSKAAMLCGRSGHSGARSLVGNSGARSLEENSGARSLGENSGARSLGENSGARSLGENSGAS